MGFSLRARSTSGETTGRAIPWLDTNRAESSGQEDTTTGIPVGSDWGGDDNQGKGVRGWRSGRGSAS